MPINHSYTAVGTNDPTKQVSVDRWNDDHVIDSYVDLPAIADPSAPAADLRLYAKSRAGRRMLNMIGPSGVDVGLQPALFGNSVVMFSPNFGGATGTTATALVSTSANASAFGSVFTTIGSATGVGSATPAITATSAYTRMRRMTLTTGTSTTGAAALYSGSGTTGAPLISPTATGFFFFSRFAIDTYVSTSQMFIGFAAAYTGAAITADPTTWNNSFGITKDTANTTGWIINNRSASASTATSTGCPFTAGQILDFTAFMAPNGSSITYRLIDAEVGTVYVDNIAVSTNLPTGPLGFRASIRSTSGSTAKVLAVNRMYLETDI